MSMPLKLLAMLGVKDCINLYFGGRKKVFGLLGNVIHAAFYSLGVWFLTKPHPGSGL